MTASSKKAESALLHDLYYPRLKQRIVDSTGLVYYSNKDSELSERVQRRLSRLGLSDCAAYFSLLSDDARGERELDELITELTIGETYFFRHREQFDVLRDRIIPALIRQNGHKKQLRIWSAGCSIGAEPYSIAILLKDDFSTQLAGWDVSILGTDINRDFLARAEEGRFDEWAFRTTDPHLRSMHFVRSGNCWAIDPGLKKNVVFQYHNLLRHPFPSLIHNLAALDLIVCRNVMIYFDQATSLRTLAHFEESLGEGGWLLLGHAEQLSDCAPSLRPVPFPGTLLYQKQGASPAPAPPAPRLPEPALEPGPEPAPGPAPATSARAAESQARPDVPGGIDTIRALADRGDFAGAVRCCELLERARRLDATGHFYYALVLEQIGRHEEAEQVLKRVIQLDRSFVLGHYYLGLLCQRQKEAARAQRSFEQARALLAGLADDVIFTEADGISVRELRGLVQSYLEVP